MSDDPMDEDDVGFDDAVLVTRDNADGITVERVAGDLTDDDLALLLLQALVLQLAGSIAASLEALRDEEDDD